MEDDFMCLQCPAVILISRTEIRSKQAHDLETSVSHEVLNRVYTAGTLCACRSVASRSMYTAMSLLFKGALQDSHEKVPEVKHRNKSCQKKSVSEI